ncbi:DeoR/GlpR family DNA-binding transcription regulator [Methylopila henanensis]|uniref:DeoR/GlpR family DNA-binding transcription regulator n=1 Tax=Methylopila henanensis TaxID=873516 RepID=A0ABW4K4X5_9HYPH
MDQTRRQRAILDLVRDEDVTRVIDLAERLSVSDETIRRNVKDLVAEGLLVRRHGAVALAEAMADAPFRRRLRVNAAAKKALASAVAERVRDGQALMIDTGSTTAYVAQALAQRRRRLTVVTNSIEIARHLVGRHGNRVFMAGGELSTDLAAAVGAEAAAFIRQFRADLAILSIAGVDPAGQFTDFDLDEARIARAMIDGSAERLIVADHSKFGRRAGVTICEPSEIGTLVADEAPPPDVAAWLAGAGVETVIAPRAPASPEA